VLWCANVVCHWVNPYKMPTLIPLICRTDIYQECEGWNAVSASNNEQERNYISTYLQEMIFDIVILNCLLRLDSLLGRHCVCRGQYNKIFSLLFCNLLNRWVLQCSMAQVGHCIVYAQELLTYKEMKSLGF